MLADSHVPHIYSNNFNRIICSINVIAYSLITTPPPSQPARLLIEIPKMRDSIAAPCHTNSRFNLERDWILEWFLSSGFSKFSHAVCWNLCTWSAESRHRLTVWYSDCCINHELGECICKEMMRSVTVASFSILHNNIVKLFSIGACLQDWSWYTTGWFEFEHPLFNDKSLFSGRHEVFLPFTSKWPIIIKSWPPPPPPPTPPPKAFERKNYDKYPLKKAFCSHPI